MSEKVILLARQRSGTHALKSILQSHPDFYCFEEIFHADPAFRSCPENFFRFVEENGLPATALFPWNIEETLGAFWSHLDALAGDSRLQVLDVKYNSTQWMLRNWQPLSQCPRLFDYIKQNNFKVIHLTRQNALRQWVSGELAARRKVWSISPGTQELPQSICIEIEPLLWTLQGMYEEDDLIWKALWGYDVLGLEYADLFLQPDGRVPQPILKEISDWFGVVCTFENKPHCAKQLARPLTALIENYDEVKRVIEGTEFGWMLEDEPGTTGETQ